MIFILIFVEIYMIFQYGWETVINRILNDFEVILEKRLNTFYTAVLVFWLNFPLNVYYIYKASNVGSTSLGNKKEYSYHAMRWLCDETLQGLNLQLKNREIIRCNWKNIFQFNKRRTITCLLSKCYKSFFLYHNIM